MILEEIPYTSTGPATVNIFPPTPITYPSDLYSIAGETIEFANPVIGIKEPAPANFPILLNIFWFKSFPPNKIKYCRRNCHNDKWNYPIR